MLRISIYGTDNETTLKLEGKLIGPWIAELKREWNGLMPLPPGKKICLDLRAMTFVDRNGVEALQRIWQLTGAEILVDTPLTRDFAQKIRGTTVQEKNKENQDAQDRSDYHQAKL